MPTSPLPSIHIGTAAWSIPRNHVALFPDEGSHLERYAAVFNCVEINSCFYRPHRAASYTRWARSTPQDFHFSVKVPKAITHQSEMRLERAVMEKFLDEVRHLGDKLGPVLFQFPPRQEFDEAFSRDFFGLFRDLYPTGAAAVEPRHVSWFSPDADALLGRFQMARVMADPPPAPQASHPGGDAGLIYRRLHGFPRVYSSNYSAEYLRSLAASLLSCSQVAEAWCIFDNTALGAATENALALMQNLRQAGTSKLQ